MKTLMVLGWMMGFVATLAFGLWGMSLVIYVFTDAGDPGLIAYTPKWIFLFAPLIFLGKTKSVQDVILKVSDLAFGKGE